MKKSSKTEAKNKVQKFFVDIKNKNPKEIKKIKRLAMQHNVSLKNSKKKFCKKCLAPYKNPKIRINNKMKSITCENCGSVSRWKLNSS